MAKMNETPDAMRVQIAFFGSRNAGKSSLLNAITGQNLAIVSDVKGTTTDPVTKSMELLPAGPVTLIDTPGLDDEGSLGRSRVQKALQVLRRTDVAVMVADSSIGLTEKEDRFLLALEEKKIPHILVLNKKDKTGAGEIIANILKKYPDSQAVSAVTGEGIPELLQRLAALADKAAPDKPIVSDLVLPGEFVVLVVPIDKAAPKGRLILPVQQVIRDLLDHGAFPVVTKETGLSALLKQLGNRVSLVITDSQVFPLADRLVPPSLRLTSFSILFARYRGELALQLRGTAFLDSIEDGDRILIAEGCTHHRQCGDIGTEKIPALLKGHTGKDIRFEFARGGDFPDSLSPYRGVIHCGGCMLSEKEMKARIAGAVENNVPITNYGMVIAKCTGILDRSIQALEGHFPSDQDSGTS